MADEKQNASKKAINTLREKLADKEKLKETLLEGLKSTNSKVRALAAAQAFKLQDNAFIKQNVIPLIKSDKSKKVLRSIAGRLNRKELADKLKALTAGISKKVKKADQPAEPKEDAKKSS